MKKDSWLCFFQMNRNASKTNMMVIYMTQVDESMCPEAKHLQ